MSIMFESKERSVPGAFGKKSSPDDIEFVSEIDNLDNTEEVTCNRKELMKEI